MSELSELEFKKLCLEQINRLGVFEKFQFMPPAAVKEYRKFFENRTRDGLKVAMVIDRAIEFESMPTISDLLRVWGDLFPYIDQDQVETEDEKYHRRNWMKDWYEQEARDAENNRKRFLEASSFRMRKVTTDEIMALAQGALTKSELSQRLRES